MKRTVLRSLSVVPAKLTTGLLVPEGATVVTVRESERAGEVCVILAYEVDIEPEKKA